MKKVLLNIIFVIYVVIAIFVTVCLLSYNQFKVTEFGDYSIIIVDSNDLEPDFNKGDLLILNKDDEPEVGQKAFFYTTYERQAIIKEGEIEAKEPLTSTETTYTVSGGNKLSSEYIIGASETATKISGLGTVLGILESKWGFLFLIVLPALLAFFYQISVVVSEVKEGKEEKVGKVNKEKTTDEEK